jgi:hypothetical protein
VNEKRKLPYHMMMGMSKKKEEREELQRERVSAVMRCSGLH